MKYVVEHFEFFRPGDDMPSRIDAVVKSIEIDKAEIAKTQVCGVPLIEILHAAGVTRDALEHASLRELLEDVEQHNKTFEGFRASIADELTKGGWNIPRDTDTSILLRTIRTLALSPSDARPLATDEALGELLRRFGWNMEGGVSSLRAVEGLLTAWHGADNAAFGFSLIVSSILKERARQDAKYGPVGSKPRSIAHYLLVARKELEEAEQGWMKNLEGRDSALSEIVQVAAILIACLQEHGTEKEAP